MFSIGFHNLPVPNINVIKVKFDMKFFMLICARLAIPESQNRVTLFRNFGKLVPVTLLISSW